MQLANKLLIQLLQLLFVGLEGLPESDEGLQCLVDQLVSRGVRDFNKDRDRHQIKGILLVQVGEALHHHQEVVLLGEELVMLKVIHHLQAELVLSRGPALLFVALFDRLLAHRSLLANAWVCVTEACKLYPITDWVPLEIEHRVDGLNLDPPASLL